MNNGIHVKQGGHAVAGTSDTGTGPVEVWDGTTYKFTLSGAPCDGAARVEWLTELVQKAFELGRTQQGLDKAEGSEYD